MSDGYPIFRADDMVSTKDIARVIDEAPTVWHPFTEEPTEKGRQYLVQHYYKTWGGRVIITYEVADSLEELLTMVRFNKKDGNRDNHYQAWMKIEPYEEADNDMAWFGDVKTDLAVGEFLENLPPVQPKIKIKPIGYRECSDAMLKMWMDNVLTDGEYYRIMDKLNAKWSKMNEVAE